jgi:hypothetical protein
VVYAGTDSGIYVTANYGDTWKSQGSGLPQGDTVAALTFIASSAGTLYAGTTAHGVYVSQNGGATWAALNDGLPVHANIYALVHDPATNTVFAALSGGPGIFAVELGGTAWAARNAGLPSGADCFAILPLPAHSATAAALYAGTSKGAYKSTDGGQSWSSVGLAGSRVLALAPDPATPGGLYAGTDASVYRSADGQNWQNVAAGIQHPVAVLLTRSGASNRTIVFAGAGDLLRYPPHANPQSSGIAAALSFVVLAVLAGVVFYFFRRNLRILNRLMERPSGGGGPSGTERSGGAAGSAGSATTADGPPETEQNGHAPTQTPQR